MFHRFFVLACLLTTLAAGGAAHAQSEQVGALSLDDASALGTVIVNDTVVKAEGAAAVKVTTIWPVVINLGEIDVLGLEGGELIYQAQVRSRKLVGTAFLEMWIHYAESGPFFSRGLDHMVSKSTPWQTMETAFTLVPGHKPEKVTLNLAINGAGEVWIDDIRLLHRPLE